MNYQRAVRFEFLGVQGSVDRQDWIRFGNHEFHLDDASIESPVRQAIHKVRNGEWSQPKRVNPLQTGV